MFEWNGKKWQRVGVHAQVVLQEEGKPAWTCQASDIIVRAEDGETLCYRAGDAPQDLLDAMEV